MERDKVRILLILPKDKTYQYRGAFSRSLSYAPLTLTTLAGLVPNELNAQIEIVDEGVEKPSYRKNYDIVGITCVASSSPRAYELAKGFRSQGSFVVLGGAHPTLMPKEAIQHADSVVIGLAEYSWPRLLLDWKAGCPQKIYRHPRQQALYTPLPRRDLLPRKTYLNIPTVLATMGCNNSCSFCCINRLWGDQYRREIDDVVEEISNLRAPTILFLDPNLTYDNDYAKELLERLIPLKIRWAGLAGMNLVQDQELLNLVVRSGCRGLLMGFESFCQDSLIGIDKRNNEVNKFRHIVECLHKNEIGVLGTFMLGLDGDTPESIRATVDHIDKIGLELARFSVLTPFPGTPLFDQFKKDGRILTENWYYYDQEHVVFQPRNMTACELQQSLFDTWKGCYTYGRITNRVWNEPKRKLFLFALNAGFRRYGKRLAANSGEYNSMVNEKYIDARSGQREGYLYQTQ